MITRFIRERRAETVNLGHPRDPVLRDWFGGVSASSGINVTEDVALTYSGYTCAITVISETIASLPCNVFSYVNGTDSQPVPNHPLQVLVHDRPNEEMSSFDCWESLSANKESRGIGILEIIRTSGGDAAALIPHPARNVMVDRTKAGKLVFVVSQGQGTDRPLGNEDVLYYRNLSDDGVSPRSLLKCARDSIGLSLALERTQAKLFANGIMPGGVVQLPAGRQPMDEEQVAQLRTAINQFNGGVDKAGNLLILPGGEEVKPWGINPEDAEALGSRQMGVRDMSRFTRIPPHLLGDLSDAKYANIEQQALDFVMHSLRPRLVRIEREANWKLFKPSERGRLFIKFSIEGLLRGDMKSRFESYQIAFMNGFKTINEIRKLEDMNPIGPEGDVRFVPVNEQTLTNAIKAKPEASASGGDDIGRAFEGLLEAAFKRLASKEAKRVAEIRKKHQEVNSLRSALCAFYEDNTGAVRDAVEPIVGAWSRALKGPKDMSGYLDSLAHRYAAMMDDRDYSDDEWPARMATTEGARLRAILENSNGNHN